MAKALNELKDELRALLEAIGDAFSIALVGGLAVSVRTKPRFTHDLDFAVAVDSDAVAEQVVHHLIQRGFALEATLENKRHGRLGTVRLRRVPDAPIVDLLFAAAGIEVEAVAAADPMTVLGQRVRVATIGHLIAFKLVSRDDKLRPQDVLDLHALTAAADTEDWQVAEATVRLIEHRGFGRSRDLHAALVEWRASSRS